MFASTADVRGLPEDSEQPIHFRADNVEGDLVGGSVSPADDASSDSPTKRVVATGSVQIDQGSMRLEAHRVVFERVGDRITLISAEGDPARYRQQLEPGADFVEARATNIIYRPEDNQIELNGRAWLSRGSDEFRGDVIRYDLHQGKVEAFGEKDGVEMILQPESPQPGSARGVPSHENSLQPGSARGVPSHENSLQPGSARGVPSHATNASGERQRPGAVDPRATSGAGAEPSAREREGAPLTRRETEPKAPAVGHPQENNNVGEVPPQAEGA